MIQVGSLRYCALSNITVCLEVSSGAGYNEMMRGEEVSDKSAREKEVERVRRERGKGEHQPARDEEEDVGEVLASEEL
ncbi:hypothetical protein E2C01_102616 [Portunus trituberculatus]|uniref:Uncharacterized protein n=1 Tax=Portunus trituberculatus TaxID=210409 RepID=A0A5B7KN05_PORTR|nr:hypothetical protein [Portunus trituberculatus]